MSYEKSRQSNSETNLTSAGFYYVSSSDYPCYNFNYAFNIFFTT